MMVLITKWLPDSGGITVKKRSDTIKYLKKHYELYLFLLPCLIFYAVFKYAPIYGLQIAFKDYSAFLGIWGSKFIGLENFQRFFSSAYFVNIIRNTLTLSILTLTIGFPAPIIFALLLNQVEARFYKRLVQTTTYMPYFISVVVLVGMMYNMLDLNTGVINHLLIEIGLPKVFFMGSGELFPFVFTFSGLWQTIGWSSIIYLAALSSINPELYEAANVDGANKLQKIIHVDIPGILPTIVIMFIMSSGQMMSVGFEKVYLMQNPLNLSWSEVISTFVYTRGLLQSEFGYATAVGLFESVINFLIVISANSLSKKLTGNSLW